MAVTLPSRVVEAIRSVVGADESVALHEPDIGPLEKQLVNECLDSTFVSSVGAFVGRFEEAVAGYTGAAAAVAVANGTVALQLALELVGVQAGDAVVVPALSFIATANAVRHVGAHPHFVDVEDSTAGMSPESLERLLIASRTTGGELVEPGTGRRIAAVVPMHTLGHPMRIAALMEVADRFGLPVVEDAAESLGSTIGGRHTGTFGRVGALSFNGNKIATTGGGGMLLTDDIELARRAKHLTTTAKLPHPWEFEHDEAAYNFRLPNLNAALGVAQIARLPEFIQRKRTLADRYAEGFAGMPGVRFLREPEGTRSNYWLCAIRLEGGMRERDAVLRAASDAGLHCRPFWNLLTNQAPYRNEPAEEIPTASELHASVVCLPSSGRLGSLAGDG